MHIAVLSASAAVTRTLEAVVTATGHTLAPAESAALAVIDCLHPAPDTHITCERFTLISRDSEDACTTTYGALCPIHPEQLIRLLKSRSESTQLPLARNWQLDLSARTLTHPDLPAVSLTEKEAALLAALHKAKPQPLSRDALLAEVWGITHEIDTHTLETHIYRLRHKLGSLTPVPCDILTEDGSYRLAC